jgi:hypothetical protein
MVRPCVASGFAELAVSGLASMYPAFDWTGSAHHVANFGNVPFADDGTA